MPKQLSCDCLSLKTVSCCCCRPRLGLSRFRDHVRNIDKGEKMKHTDAECSTITHLHFKSFNVFWVGRPSSALLFLLLFFFALKDAEWETAGKNKDIQCLRNQLQIPSGRENSRQASWNTLKRLMPAVLGGKNAQPWLKTNLNVSISVSICLRWGVGSPVMPPCQRIKGFVGMPALFSSYSRLYSPFYCTPK